MILEGGLILALNTQPGTGAGLLRTDQRVGVRMLVTGQTETTAPPQLRPVFPVPFGTGDAVISPNVGVMAVQAMDYARALAVLPIDEGVEKIVDDLVMRHQRKADKRPLKRRS